MNVTAQISSLPWSLDEAGFIESDGYLVAKVVLGLNTATRDANAAFIVRACNSHDKLVEALKWSLQTLSKGSPCYEAGIAALAAAGEPV